MNGLGMNAATPQATLSTDRIFREIQLLVFLVAFTNVISLAGAVGDRS